MAVGGIDGDKAEEIPATHEKGHYGIHRRVI